VAVRRFTSSKWLHQMAFSSVAFVAVGCSGVVPQPAFLDSFGTPAKLTTIDSFNVEQQSRTAPVPLESAPDVELLPKNRASIKYEADGALKIPMRQWAPTPGSEGDTSSNQTVGDDSSEPELVEVSLEEARVASLENNLDLQVSLVDPLVAREQISEAEWVFETTFGSSLSRTRNDAPPGSLGLGPAGDRENDQFQSSFNFPLMTGGSISLTPASYQRFNLRGPISSFYDYTANVAVQQPLLRGGGLTVNTSSIRLAQLQSGIVDAQTKLTAIAVLAEVERAYWNAWGSNQLTGISQQQLELAREQLEKTKRLVPRLLSNIEVMRAEAGVLSRIDSVVINEAQARIAARNLRRVMQSPSLPVEAEVVLTTSTPPHLVGLDFDPRQITQQAIDNRQELLQLELSLLQNELSTQVAENAVLPRLDFQFSSSILGTGRSTKSSRNQAFSDEFDRWTAGISAEIPLAGNQSAQARVRQLELARLQTLIDQDRVRVRITQEVLNAIDVFNQNWNRILAARSSVKAAQRVYEAELRLLELGQRSGDLVLQAAANLATAQTLEVQAIVGYQIAKVDLAVATGTMLGFGQVQWGELRPVRPANAVEPVLDSL
jgi:outer membrane protein